MFNQVTVSLVPSHDEKWMLFHSEVNEMIVTKTGRNFFPKLEYIVEGLDPSKLYAMMIQIEPVGDSRYKFSNGKWAVSGKGDVHAEAKKAWHADGVRSGKEWMDTTVAFDRLKISNDLQTRNAWMIPLHSMHKYVPVLTIYESPSESPFVANSSNQCIASVRIPHTEFIAVTAYQNQKVTELKIKFNDYAKGFRKEKENRKRRSPSDFDYSTDSTESTSKSSSPQPKYSRASSSSPPEFDLPSPSQPINPFLFSLPPFSQMVSGNMPSLPFFPFGMPPFSTTPTPSSPKSSPRSSSSPEISIPSDSSEKELTVIKEEPEESEEDIDVLN
ncbi:hypothetical protein GCK72_010488 [Caenorhabditis remanei]|uniref:T-box domain-containing protein n=1 Tax=Caenorhabditis remanei TaxID=31234 RepID=A0A6A5H5V2_CAERE|nr:hypothetical protein GCK72_010488 [Caenorhabditis remanei]KAF1762226.1 hypothetical protein GCK72_010488 [Caenorhabditis remanei]